MNYRRLGRTNLQVSEIGLGTVELGLDYGVPVAGEPLRAQLGGPRIVITRHGGWRSVEINRDVGGATRSQHLLGRAADIVVWSGGHVVAPRDVGDVVLRLMRSGAIIAGGVGVYSGFTHVDTRGRVTTW